MRRRRARKEGAAQAALRQRVPAEGGAGRGGPRTSCTGELGCVETVILEVFASALTERESEPAGTRGAKASAASAHRPSSVRVREESAAKVRRTGRRQARPETFATSGRTADRETTQVADEEVKAARRESSRRSTRRSCRLGLGRCTFILQSACPWACRGYCKCNRGARERTRRGRRRVWEGRSDALRLDCLRSHL